MLERSASELAAYMREWVYAANARGINPLLQRTVKRLRPSHCHRRSASLVVRIVRLRKRIAHKLRAEKVLVLQNTHDSRDHHRAIQRIQSGIIHGDDFLNPGACLGP